MVILYLYVSIYMVILCYAMVILWLYYGHTMVILWIYYGYTIVIVSIYKYNVWMDGWVCGCMDVMDLVSSHSIHVWYM